MQRTGSERLRAYCENYCKGRQNTLAELLEMNEAHLSQVLAGLRRPGLPLAVRIYQRTGVPMESWLLTPRGSKKTRAKSDRDSAQVA